MKNEFKHRGFAANKTLIFIMTLFCLSFFGLLNQSSACEFELRSGNQISPSPSVYAREKLAMRGLAHGTSLVDARAAIADGALHSSASKKRLGNFNFVAQKASLRGVFTQALFSLDRISEVLNYRDSIPFDPKDPDLGGTFVIRYFDVIFVFDLRLLDEFPLYAAPGWSYDPPADKIATDPSEKVARLASLQFSDARKVKDPRLVNEVVFRVPDGGLPFSFLVGIDVHGDADQVREIQSILTSDLRRAGWKDEQIGELFQNRFNQE